MRSDFPPLCEVAVSMVAVPLPEQFGKLVVHDPVGVPAARFSNPSQSTALPQPVDGLVLVDGDADAEADRDGEPVTDGDGEAVRDGDRVVDGDGLLATQPEPVTVRSVGAGSLPDQVPCTPNSVVALGASVPFQPTLVAVTAVPDWVTLAFQLDVIFWPAG
jgi:hypothetical protein